MTFKDFQEIAPSPLSLPINGKTYTIPPVSAATGLQAWKMIRSGKLSNDEPAKVEDIARLLLGDVQRDLIADKVSWQALNRVYLTVISDFTNGRSAAEVMWETGGNPKALMGMNVSNRQDEATTIPKPDSTNTTKISPRKHTRES